MLCDDIIRVLDVNVCADELCACILAEFQQLSTNETIGEAGMFSDISMILRQFWAYPLS